MLVTNALYPYSSLLQFYTSEFETWHNTLPVSAFKQIIKDLIIIDALMSLRHNNVFYIHIYLHTCIVGVFSFTEKSVRELNIQLYDYIVLLLAMIIHDVCSSILFCSKLVVIFEEIITEDGGDIPCIMTWDHWFCFADNSFISWLYSL